MRGNRRTDRWTKEARRTRRDIAERLEAIGGKETKLVHVTVNKDGRLFDSYTLEVRASAQAEYIQMYLTDEYGEGGKCTFNVIDDGEWSPEDIPAFARTEIRLLLGDFSTPLDPVEEGEEVAPPPDTISLGLLDDDPPFPLVPKEF